MSDDATTPAPDAPVEAAGPRPALDKKKSIIFGLLGLAVLVIIFVKVIPQIGSYSDALEALKTMNARDVVLIALAVLVYLAWYPLPFMAATPGLPYGRAFQLNQGAFAISNGIPAGGAFGLGVQYAMLASWRVPPTVATAAIGAVGVWSVFVTLGLPVLGVFMLYAGGFADASSYIKYAAIGLVVLLAMIVVFALVMSSEKLAVKVGELGGKVVNPLLRRFKKDEMDVVGAVLKFRNDIVDLVRRRWAAITVTQLGVSITQGLILLVALWGVEGDGDRTNAFLVLGAYAVAQIMIMIPITPGGLGTVDALMLGILTAAGVSDGAATAATLVWRASSFVPQILVGVLSLVWWSRTAAKRLNEGSVAQAGTATTG
ncbi:MAG: YbhN family protein [Candidatus Nanopelagicales bacterium]